MKKVKILIVSVLFCAMGYAGYTTYEKMTMSEAEKFMKVNIEALTSNQTEFLKGRWRTVGCGSYNFSDWKTYCCPHDFFQNCPNKGACKSATVYGCEGK